MKQSNGVKYEQTKKTRFWVILLCTYMVLFMLGISATVFAAETELDPNEQIKARLMYQIQYEGWDPYSSTMTTDEFYALMELFNEGRLPLTNASKARKVSALNATEGVTVGTAIPRTYFMYAGLPAKFYGGFDEELQIEREVLMLPYENDENYEMSDPKHPELQEPWKYIKESDIFIYQEDNSEFKIETYADPETGRKRQVLRLLDDGEPTETIWEMSERLLINYPSGLEVSGADYARPLLTWDGVDLGGTPELTIVRKTQNAAPAGGYVIQDIFQPFEGYYIKNVTVAGADIIVLGVITLTENGEEKYVYYYKTALGQDSEVSSTTLPDNTKFIVQYMPDEHTVEYSVNLTNMDDNGNITGTTDVTNTWVDRIFGENRPEATTDGSYAFTAYAPHGYKVDIYISFELTIEEKYLSKQPSSYEFYVVTHHTGNKAAMRDAYLQAYKEYLIAEKLILDEEFGYTQEGELDSGEIKLLWKSTNNADEAIHNSVLKKIAERVNDFTLHNNGYAIGEYPVYPTAYNSGTIVPDLNAGPASIIEEDVFYNNSVKADRKVNAVLTELGTPQFVGNFILGNNENTSTRGGSADEDYALNFYEDDFLYHNNKKLDDDGNLVDYQYDVSEHPVQHSHNHAWPNLGRPENNSFSWESFAKEAKNMVYNPDTGLYDYTYVFQTNNGGGVGGFTLNSLAINGISVPVPLAPWYNGQTSKWAEHESDYSASAVINGAIVTVKYMELFSSGAQRVYLISIKGAYCNMVLTGMNLMMSSGAREFSVYNIDGIYAGEDQEFEAIEYFDGNSWVVAGQAKVVVNIINYAVGDKYLHGANIRFKIKDGYGNPYYYFRSASGMISNDGSGVQTSILQNENGTYPISGSFEYNPTLSIDSVNDNEQLLAQYIYQGTGENSDYYYIRLYEQGGEKMAALSIIARTIKYIVRYEPTYIGAWEEDGNIVDWAYDEEGNFVLPDKMPTFVHNDTCDLSQKIKKANDVLLEKDPNATLMDPAAFDDNVGSYYDGFYNNQIKIASNNNGKIIPVDPSGYFLFAGWILVDMFDNAVKDENGNFFIYYDVSTINLNTIIEFAYNREEFGSDIRDIRVFRFNAIWTRVNNPYHYNVYLSWVDAMGKINVEKRTESWSTVLTQEPSQGSLVVHLNKDSKPLLNWIAKYPTYTFWDEVNNAITSSKEEEYSVMLAAVKKYFAKMPTQPTPEQIEDIVEALMNRDYNDTGSEDFERVGKDNYIVKEDYGVIVIWMYEDKGGFIFHNEVSSDSLAFEKDEEFYYSVYAQVNGIDDDGNEVRVPLNGVYKAYPETVVDIEGNVLAVTDADAWILEFRDGFIFSMTKNDKILQDANKNNITYFTLKDGDGIQLYMPDGIFEIYELGTKSGGSYKVDVRYAAANGGMLNQDNWVIPTGHVVKGNTKILEKDQNVNTPFEENSHVRAIIAFVIGEMNVVQTLTFKNMNTVLQVEKILNGSKDYSAFTNMNFSVDVTITLPTENGTVYQPMSDNQGYYFNMMYDRVAGGVTYSKIRPTQLSGNKWLINFTLKSGDKAFVIMRSPYVTKDVDEPTIQYYVEEKDPNIDGMTISYSAQEGTVVSDTNTIVIITNYYGEVAYGYLAITEIGGQSNESFLYKITNVENGSYIIVSVKGEGRTYVYARLGTYTIEEISDWSWKYEDGVCKEDNNVTFKNRVATVVIGIGNIDTQSAVNAEYTHKRNDKVWLGEEKSTSSK